MMTVTMMLCSCVAPPDQLKSHTIAWITFQCVHVQQKFAEYTHMLTPNRTTTAAATSGSSRLHAGTRAAAMSKQGACSVVVKVLLSLVNVAAARGTWHVAARGCHILADTLHRPRSRRRYVQQCSSMVAVLYV